MALPERIIREVHHFTMPPLYKNVAIYCRVSSRFQEQLDSAANQASFFVKMVAKRNGWKLVDIFLDFRSGESTTERHEFLRMIDMCQRREIDIILTKSISRFGRNTEDTLTALRTIKETGACIIFDEEGIDTRVEDSELMISLLSAYAQAENESRRQNQLWGIRKRLQDGSSDLYRRPCYGFRKKDDNELVIEPHEAGIVQNIYQMYLDGASIIGIQRQLANNEVLSPSGKETWSKRSIEQILQNEKYIGDAAVFKTYSISSKRVINNDGSHEQFVIRGNHPAIITQEIFDAVQQIRNLRSNVYRDEVGSHRKSTKYSSKRKVANKSET